MAIIGVAGVTTLVSPVINAAIAANAALPEVVQVAALFATPLVALIGIVLTILHIGGKVAAVQAQTIQMEIKYDGNMDKLIAMAEENALAQGVIIGHDNAVAEAQVVSDRALMDEGLKKLGADNLLREQATLPAEHP